MTTTTFVVIIDDMMVDEIQTIVAGLGGEAAVGSPVRSSLDMAGAIRKGFYTFALSHVASVTGISLKQLAFAMDLSYRTVQRHKSEQRLGGTASDRLYRLVRIVTLAEQYIGDPDKAKNWLQHPNKALGNKRPFDLLDTEPGAREVENVLGLIAYGGVS